MAQPDSPHPLLTPLLPATPNYHISIWDEPPTYVCLRCPAVGMTLPEVSLHVQVDHGELPLPTPMIESLLAMREASPPPPAPEQQTTIPDPPTEEPPHG
jgi:hypothetical protein